MTPDDSLRLIQVFLTKDDVPGPSVFEVSLSPKNKVVCTCPGYRGRGECKHQKIVLARLDADNNYPFEISEKATQVEGEHANHSNKDFREFIIKYGKIEVV